MPDLSVPNVEPKVSVLMITYNHEKFIAQAIESVLMQKTDFPFELVIGEDCSTDRTGEIVREYSRKYPEVIRAYVRERNLGMLENGRQVFFASRGKYLAALEGDDYWTSPRKLQVQADLLDAHPETAVCGHHTVRHYDDGSQPDKDVFGTPGGFYGIEHILFRNILHTSSAMFRRVIEDIAPEWRRHLPMGDIPLFVELAQHGNIYMFEETMGVYRVHAGGVWSRLSEVQQDRNSVAMYHALYGHVDPKFRPALDRGMFRAVYTLGLAQFTAGDLAETRRCLRECLRISGPLEFVPEKALLAFKGYGWWTLALWRKVRRLGRRSQKT